MRHPAEVIADFQEYYNLNFLDIFDNPHANSMRWGILVEQLPRESRTAMALLGADGFRGWSWNEDAMHLIVSSLAHLSGDKELAKQIPSPYSAVSNKAEAKAKQESATFEGMYNMFAQGGVQWQGHQAHR